MDFSPKIAENDRMKKSNRLASYLLSFSLEFG
jgi:hypothetical protein